MGALPNARGGGGLHRSSLFALRSSNDPLASLLHVRLGQTRRTQCNKIANEPCGARRARLPFIWALTFFCTLCYSAGLTLATNSSEILRDFPLSIVETLALIGRIPCVFCLRSNLHLPRESWLNCQDFAGFSRGNINFPLRHRFSV